MNGVWKLKASLAPTDAAGGLFGSAVAVSGSNPDIVWAGLFVVFAVLLGLLCAVVVGYLTGGKAQVTFGLPPGETPRVLRSLRAVVLALYALAALIGPMFSGVRVLFPD